MRGRRWFLVGILGLGSCLLAGCLRAALPLETQPLRYGDSTLPSAPSPSSQASANRSETGAQTSQPASDYLASRTPAAQLNSQPIRTAAKASDNESLKPPGKPIEPVEMRIQSEESSSPPHPVDPLPPRREAHETPLTRPEFPSVQVLRGLLDRQPAAELAEQLKCYDPATREVMLLLLTNIAEVEQLGGITRVPPRELAAWTNRLDMLTDSLRTRAQLILENMCFCSSINNFGDYVPLPPEHAYFQRGEVAHIYVQARNLSCRHQGDKYVTVLKSRFEIFDENNRVRPQITESDGRVDVSAAPRQDFYINFRFTVPMSCPSGLYTLRVTVEDWTAAAAGAKQVPERRIARFALDFRVGGPVVRPARRIAEAPVQR